MARMGDMVGSGLDELTVTTNAVLLADHAEMLARSGVRRRRARHSATLTSARRRSSSTARRGTATR